MSGFVASGCFSSGRIGKTENNMGFGKTCLNFMRFW